MNEPRYRCWHCRDTGFTEEWSEATLHPLMAYQEPAAWLTVMAHCDCEFGRRQHAAGLDLKRAQPNKRIHVPRIFDKAVSLRAPWNQDDEAKQAARTWAANRREFLDENTSEGMFARYNENGVE